MAKILRKFVSLSHLCLLLQYTTTALYISTIYVIIWVIIQEMRAPVVKDSF